MPGDAYIGQNGFASNKDVIADRIAETLLAPKVSFRRPN